MSATTRASALPCTSSPSAPVASREAISPARAPPMPSATANIGGSHIHESSLPRRLRPGWESLCCARASSLEAELRLADANEVAGVQLAGPGKPDAVDVGAVRRADVLDPDAVAARLDPRVARRGELIGVEPDVVLPAAADGDPGRVELELGVLVDRGALAHEEPAHARAGLGAEAGRGRLVGSEDEALLGEAQVAARRAHDAPDEEVEEHEKSGLEEEEHSLHVD